MRQAAGQVARQAHRAAHYLLGAFTLLLLGLAVLGWRLAQGPIEVPYIARTLEDSINSPEGGTRLAISQATVAWQGRPGEGFAPLELRLAGVRMVGQDGAVRAELPEALVSLSIPWLLRGEIAPRRLELRHPVLRLRRSETGELSLQLGAPGAAPEGEETAPQPDAKPLERLLGELMRPPSEDTPRSALDNLAVSGAQVTVEDAALGAVWSLEDAAIHLRRLPAGGVAGRGVATLRLGAGSVRVTGTAEARGEPAEIALRLVLPEIRPAELAGLAPPLAPLAGLDASARLELSGRLRADGGIEDAGAVLIAGRGVLDLGQGRRIPIAALEVEADWRPGFLGVPRALLRLDGPGTPTLTGSAEAGLAEGRWRGSAQVALDAAPLAALSRWWPAGLGSGERDWILANITAGTARNGRWRVEGEAREDFSGLALSALGGTLEVADATVHWLRPIPPVEEARGEISFSLTEVAVRVASARQSGTAVQARDARLRFLFPPGEVPATEMQIGLAGPVPDALAVLQHPRLRLFERRPLPLKDPQGTLEGSLTIGFPLLAELPVEQLRLRAQAKLREVRITDLLLNRPLERGQFDLTVDNDGLRVAGTATLAEIQARLGVEMDFRSGPANQVVVRETVQARPQARQLAALGLADEAVVRGPVALEVRTERRRNGAGRVNVRADLREAQLAIGPLRWSKPAGQNAGGEAVLRLSGENLEAIEGFRVEAPALLLRGSAALGRGTQLQVVTISEAQVDASRFAGEARPPGTAGGPWAVTLRGAVLDLRRALAEDSPSASPGEPGPAVLADVRFERVLLGPGRELAAVEGRVLVDGRGVLREGRLAGRAGPRGPFEATLTPQRTATGEGRALRLAAEDAGALLHSFNLLQHLEGGRLSVNGTYAHNAPGAPLSGTAELADFSVRNAPGFAKLLQAMTLYGLVEAVSGPGLGFSRLIAPFALTPQVLALEDARAFSASLGLTAKGTLDRQRQRLAMEGTIVPAYVFNSLLGNIPIFGRLFSPEAGGGVFAATWRAQGPIDDPQVSVNPLAALTPGFLRGLFGLGQAQQQQ